jgi:hypothetical protein
MLFWLFVIVLVVGASCVALGGWMYRNTKYDTDWLKYTGWVIVVLAVLAIVISGIAMLDSYGNAEAMVAQNHKRYESLVYQLENNLYDNDNDLGKKELYNEIREWNEDLAYYQNIQDSFWLGIYYPNVFDQFDFIELGN